MQKIKAKHKPIAQYFDDPGIGNVLMNSDSMIAEKIMLHFAKQGIATLPVHDSFIVPANHADEMLGVMKTAFKEEFHQEIPIDGSEFKGIYNAIKRPAVFGRSDVWEDIKSEVICLSKISYLE